MLDVKGQVERWRCYSQYGGRGWKCKSCAEWNALCWAFNTFHCNQVHQLQRQSNAAKLEWMVRAVLALPPDELQLSSNDHLTSCDMDRVNGVAPQKLGCKVVVIIQLLWAMVPNGLVSELRGIMGLQTRSVIGCTTAWWHSELRFQTCQSVILWCLSSMTHWWPAAGISYSDHNFPSISAWQER